MLSGDGRREGTRDPGRTLMIPELRADRPPWVRPVAHPKIVVL